MPPTFPIYDRPIVLIDLDDTLAYYSGWKGWRNIGKPRPFAQGFVKAFKDHDWETILWTTRAETGYVREWLEEHKFTDKQGKLLFDYIGSNPKNIEIGCNLAKPITDLIIDNTAWPLCGRPVPLKRVLASLLRKGILNWKETRQSIR